MAPGAIRLRRGRTALIRLLASMAALLATASCGSSPGAPVWLAETLDAPGLPDAREAASAYALTSGAATYAGQPHVWYYSATARTLRHAWFDGMQWNLETLDGRGGPDGRIKADVGITPAAVVLPSGPHVWYYDALNRALRHGWFEAARWRFETLDGLGGADGRVKGDVGGTPATMVHEGQLHVWYRDSSRRTLRHAWLDGQRWRFETLDGEGGPNGRVVGDVGDGSAAVNVRGEHHVWYQDTTRGALRHAWNDGLAWRAETLDGEGGEDGRLKAPVGASVAAFPLGGQLHVWYLATTSRTLRHAWSDPRGWHFETLDGTGGKTGQVKAPVGARPGVTTYGGKLHIWCYDLSRGSLRHAWQA